jgi:hypothetical protein
VSTITVPVPPHEDDVVESAPAALWAVETHAWKELPDDVIALVATPLVVCAESR